jgi:hypothetical protein
MATTDSPDQTVLLHFCEPELPNILRFSGLQLSSSHLLETKQPLQLPFVALLGRLRRSYLNFIIIVFVIQFSSTLD